MSTAVDVALAVFAVIVIGLVRVVWALSERVSKLEGRFNGNGPTRRERRG